MKVFVTGGTGYIGERLVLALLKRGDTVHLLCRSRSRSRLMDQPTLRFYTGDILNLSSIAAGMEGCEAVTHLAGYAKNWSEDNSIFYEVNVQGTRNVFEAALRLRVKKVLCVSSVVVFGPSNSHPLDEHTERSTEFFTEYERTKYLADELGKEFLAGGLPLVTVYPTRVYGPGKDTEGNSFTRMLQFYLNGKFPFLLNGGKETANYVYVDDLVNGILLALKKGRAGGRYILGGENVSLEKIFETADRITHRKHFRLSLPPFVARLVSRISEINAKLLGIYPAITPGWVETFLQDWVASSAVAEKELGYHITPLHSGLERTIEWLKQQREQR